MIRVAVDAMGGDRGPQAVVEGALAACSDRIEPVVLGSAGLDTRGLELVPTTQVVGMDEKPADAFRTKADSSLVRAVKAVADGEADGVGSRGSPARMCAARSVRCASVAARARPPPPRPPGPPAPRRHDGSGLRGRDARDPATAGAPP